MFSMRVQEHPKYACSGAITLRSAFDTPWFNNPGYGETVAHGGVGRHRWTYVLRSPGASFKAARGAAIARGGGDRMR